MSESEMVGPKPEGSGAEGPTDKSHPPTNPTSAVVYVLFHESSAEAAEIAKTVYERLRRPDEDVWRSRVGIPVYVRARAAPERVTELMEGTEAPARVGNIELGPLRLQAIQLPPSGWDPEKPAPYPVRTFVVPLVCDQMAADPRWRIALEALARGVEAGRTNRPAEPRAVLMPVLLGAVGPGVVGLPEGGQVISAFRWTDGGAGPARVVARRDRVLRELFLWMIREMRACVEGLSDAVDAPVELFLSHAKADGQHGPRVAETLRDTIASMGHLRGWYDENDLLPGAAWQKLLTNAAGGTAAMLVVWSARYATRPWCRRELAEARRLRRILRPPEFEAWRRRPLDEPATDASKPAPVEGGEVFTSVPVVVVDTLAAEGGVTRVPPDLAALPACRWGEETPGRAVDMAIHEALMSQSNALQARAILSRLKESGSVLSPVVAVTSPPDQSVIAELVRLGAKAVLHPGYGVSLFEEMEISRRVGGPTAVELVRYDEWERLRPSQGAGEPPAAGGASCTVQISAGGDGEGLLERGMLPEHLAELIYELVNASLGADANLVYAGKPGYLQLDLVDVIASAVVDQASKKQTAHGGPEPSQTRVRFLTPWRPGVEITATEKVRNLPHCRFEDVYPTRGVGPRQPAQVARLRAELEAATEISVWNEALALSEARRMCAEVANLVVLAGGKRKGWGGIMPGLLEELCNAWNGKECRHVVLLSGFGGAASWLAELIEDPKGIPAEVTVEAHLTPGSPFRRLCSSIGADRVLIEGRWAEARVALVGLSSQYAAAQPSKPGQEGARPLLQPDRPKVHIVKIDSLRGIRAELRTLVEGAA